MERQKADLKMVAWELTRSCNLSCRHCRASSEFGPYPDELTTIECFRLIDEIVSFSSPVIILTGGEPLLREDTFKLAEYGKKQGLRMVMATNGTLLSEQNTKQIIASGVKRISISLDGPDEASHDGLRGEPGAFKYALGGIQALKNAGMEFQINSTITKANLKSLPAIMKLAKGLGAAAHHIFLLVPTGRAKDMQGEELAVLEYEDTLKFLARQKKDSSLEIKVTCAPHFNRILLEGNDPASLGFYQDRRDILVPPSKAGKEFPAYPGVSESPLRGRGCMAGIGFCFVSHIGDLQPCGYLEIKCGNVRDKGFKNAWTDSEVFNNLRDWSKYKGKCGACEFRSACGGCRARAYAKYADYLQQEPYCVYEPKTALNYV